MMQEPLLISSLLTHAERHHGEREIVSRRVEGDIHRYTYRDMAGRARCMARALEARGIGLGARVATLAWNGYRHMELHYAVSGSGAVLHTINPRLHPDQLVWIADHADDQVLFFDLTFLPVIEAIAWRVSTIKAFVAMTDREHMPASTRLPNLLCYEDLVDAQTPEFAWPRLDENTASSLCYTSGTTSHPKGALCSHRSALLHTYAAALPDALDCSSRDVILPVVPMFHANAWGLPDVACMVGAKLVFPGPWLDGKSLHELFESEGVTVSAGVPTVWQGLLAHVEANGLGFSTMRRAVVGGSTCPQVMMQLFQERYNVQVLHACGMTETHPVGTVCALKPQQLVQSAQQRLAPPSRPAVLHP
jgi:fatty-acyl-CoA synthase